MSNRDSRYSRRRGEPEGATGQPVDLASEVLRMREEQPDRLARREREEAQQKAKQRKSDREAVQRVFACSAERLSASVYQVVDREFKSNFIPALLQRIQIHLDSKQGRGEESTDPGVAHFELSFTKTVEASSSYGFTGGEDAWPTAVVVHSGLPQKACQRSLQRLVRAFDAQELRGIQTAINGFSSSFSAHFSRECEEYSKSPERTFKNIWTFDPHAVTLALHGTGKGAELRLSLPNESNVPLRGILGLLTLSALGHRLAEGGLNIAPLVFEVKEYRYSGPGLYDSTDEGLTTSGTLSISLL